MNKLHTPDQLKTPFALITMGTLGLILAYSLASRALDTGSYWQYLGGLAFLVLSVKLLVRATKK